MKLLVAFVSGVIFAVGLVVGGMTQPAKIVNFLDFFGNWDPSLAFVMGGALLVNLVAYRWVKASRDKPVIEKQFFIPTRRDLNWQLVAGGALFGVGWGVGGYCPGAALTAVGSLSTPVIAVVGGMVGGVFLYKAFDNYVMQPSSGSQGDDASESVGASGAQPIADS